MLLCAAAAAPEAVAPISRASLPVALTPQARNPPKPVEPVVYEDGTNEWISGVNGDIGEKKKKEKKAPAEKKKKPQKAE